MGHYEKPADSDNRMKAKLPSGIFVVANESAIDALKSSSLAHPFGDSIFVPLSAGSPLHDRMVSQASILVIEVDQAEPASLRRISRLAFEVLAAIDAGELEVGLHNRVRGPFWR